MKNKKYIFMTITFIWVAIIYAFTLQPGEISGDLSGSILTKILAIFAPNILNNPQQLEIWHTILRKCAHFGEYFILGILCRITLSQMKIEHKNIPGIGFCLLVAMIDETIQCFVPERAGKIFDVLIDGTGAFVGILIVAFLVNRLHTKKIKSYNSEKSLKKE